MRQIFAKRRIIMTGTAIANYPRDVLPLLCSSVGDGNAAQPYGFRGPYMEARFRTSMAYAKRGVDAFRDDYVTLAWVTNEFKEDMQEGAKREIPRIQNLHAYRAMLAPHVKRRVASEPDVAPHVRIPVPERIVHRLDWDDAHLAYYLKVADEFADWYRGVRHGDQSGKDLNLIALLARIRAVQFASNLPQHGHEGFSAYRGGLTNKQRAALERLEVLTGEGHKTILFAENPGLLDMFAAHLDRRGVESVVFHGQIPIARRTRALNERFRKGDCPVLLASYGVTKTGLNLYAADRALFFGRLWSATHEEQALGRLLRPQQRREVVAEYFQTQGSIDDYQEQMVTFKRDTAAAGLDWCTPSTDSVEFLHFDTILGRFVEDLAALRGCTPTDLRTILRAA